MYPVWSCLYLGGRLEEFYHTTIWFMTAHLGCCSSAQEQEPCSECLTCKSPHFHVMRDMLFLFLESMRIQHAIFLCFSVSGNSLARNNRQLPG